MIAPVRPGSLPPERPPISDGQSWWCACGNEQGYAIRQCNPCKTYRPRVDNGPGLHAWGGSILPVSTTPPHLSLPEQRLTEKELVGQHRAAVDRVRVLRERLEAEISALASDSGSSRGAFSR